MSEDDKPLFPAMENTVELKAIWQRQERERIAKVLVAKLGLSVGDALRLIEPMEDETPQA